MTSSRASFSISFCAARPSHHHREPRGGRWNDRRRAAAKRRRMATPSWCIHPPSFAASYSLYKSLPYDTFKDFAAVVPLGIPADRPDRCALKRLEDTRRSRCCRQGAAGRTEFRLRRRRCGLAPGCRTLPHQRRLQGAARPFRGPVEALTETMTGRIDFYFLPVAPALPLINEGKVVALAVSTASGRQRCQTCRRPRRRD